MNLLSHTFFLLDGANENQYEIAARLWSVYNLTLY